MAVYILLWILLFTLIPFVPGTIMAFAVRWWLGFMMLAYLAAVFFAVSRLKGKAAGWTYFLAMIPYYVLEVRWIGLYLESQ